jgi:hypothetical protein
MSSPASAALPCEPEGGAARVVVVPVPKIPLSPRNTGGFPGLWSTVATWLILPVVICLSQRLSHACLSISNYTAKLRMAH